MTVYYYVCVLYKGLYHSRDYGYKAVFSAMDFLPCMGFAKLWFKKKRLNFL